MSFGRSARRWRFWDRLLVPVCALAIAAAAPGARAAEKAAKAAAAVEKFDPTYVPTPAWLPKPVPVPNADAASAAAMKPYKEAIPGTDAAFELVPIPGGTYTMGATSAEFQRFHKDAKDKDAKKAAYDEGPLHEIKIEPFWMGKYEVTWDEYELWSMGLDVQRRAMTKGQTTSHDQLADAIARPTKPYTDMTFGMGKEGFPAICMTQIAAQSYCKWLSAKTGRYYRLPTEAEWEYACRAGTKTAYSFGDDPEKLGDYAWYFDNSNDKYHKVGLKKPNPWGLYDIHGNVSEWVLDKYVPDFYQQFAGKTAANPWARATTEYPRVVRGGSWDDEAERCRSAARRGSNKDWKMQDPQIPQSIWYLTDGNFVGCRVIRPLRVPTAEEARAYEPDPEVIKEFRAAEAGKQ
jgi:formylglycine-generating enzyme required for sulfatase activity